MPRITDAESRMLPQLAALEELCFSVPWTEEILRGQLPDEQHVFLTALEGERLVGYVGMTTVLDEGYISNVAVDPAERRKGIGDSLIGELLVRARERELSFVTLEVRESNLPAIRLYEKHGFRPVGLRKNYYRLPTENALLMTTFLNRGNTHEDTRV